ncbi:MAG: hypothetical protein WD426_14630 [Anditalea sp.]
MISYLEDKKVYARDAYSTHEIFGVEIPQSCPEVPDELLNPKDTWEINQIMIKPQKK